jgi:uncharacterized protein YciU (UPF0263 family)
MAHQYKRRTMDEAAVLAQNLFRSQVAEHLTEEEIEECRRHSTVGSGSPRHEWETIVGRRVSDREFYEYEIYKPSDICPYVEKIYAVILVPRSRESESCYIQWKPTLEPYEGPWFS